MLDRVANLATRARTAARVVKNSGSLSAATPAALLRFASAARGQRLGPHLAVMFHAACAPDREALVGGGRRLTYGELEREINQLCHALVARGVGPGDRVALMLPNVPEFIVALHALPRIGAVAAQIGVRLKRGEIGHILHNAAPRAILSHEEVGGELDAAIVETGGDPARLVVGSAGPQAYRAALAVHDGSRPPAARGGDAGGVIVYTSGTTGRPKGARRAWSQTGLEAVTAAIDAIDARASDRHLVACPLYHSGALAFAAMTLSLGGACVLIDHFDGEEVLATIERERITSSFMVPTMLNRLIAVAPEVRRARDLSSLRWILSGAAPLTTETARRFQAAYGHILWNFYGATETGLVSLATPADHAARPGTVGKLLPGNEVRVVGDGGRALPVGEVGELYVKNHMLVEGYHGDHAATSAAMQDGFFSVGDLARVDRDGYLYLTSRVHDMVISGGVNIYPAEIEEHLATHPDVVEAAVIGVADPEWGESLVAYVVGRAGATLDPDALIVHCRGALADYKRPRRVEVVDELPRTPTGKVLKRELRERLT